MEELLVNPSVREESDLSQVAVQAADEFLPWED